MASHKEIQRDKETESDNVVTVILDTIGRMEKKMDITNKLLQDLIQVCDNNLRNNDETLLKSVTTNIEFNEAEYHSPSEIIQQERNELALQKEASKVKQKLKLIWSRMLNSRKQLFWKEIHVNNAKDAEQYDKWINE
jgi:DUF1009 family protein